VHEIMNKEVEGKEPLTRIHLWMKQR
jgi:hypothetical protein